MNQHSQRVVFRGNSLRVIEYPALIFLPFMAVSFHLLMRVYWLRLTVFLVFLSVIPCSFLYVGSLFLNRFAFDDEKRSIVKPPRQMIPFRDVKSIEIKETCGQLSVFVRGQNHKMCTLVRGLSLAEMKRLTTEFARRFPEQMVRHRRQSTWVLLTATGLAFVFISVFLLIRSNQILAECPQVKQVPEKKTWRCAPDQLEGETYSLAGISFLVPDNLVLAKQTGDTLRFQDGGKRETFEIVRRENEEFHPLSHPFSYVALGYRSSFDRLEAMYAARFGYALIQAKRIRLASLGRVKLFEVRQNGLRGLVIEGTKAREHIVQAMVLRESKGSRIDLNLRGPGPIDDEYLSTIMGSIRATESFD